MAIICWGNLAKSADDTQRIEQSIQGYVEDHNENVNAHQVYGSSLYMHRVQEKLDHLQRSIDLRYLGADRFFFLTGFESVDGWSKSGSFTASILCAILATTAIQDNEAYALIDIVYAAFNLNITKDPFFQTTLSLGNTTNQLIYFGLGDFTGSDEADAFGFKISNNTLYADVRIGANHYSTQISGITLTNANTYRAYYSSDDSCVYFYVNGVLKHTETSNLPSSGGSYLFTYYIKTLTAAIRRLYIADLLIEQYH